MIIVRSPLRISLGGGGTDLPSYYREHEGKLIAGAINKYVYIVLQEAFVRQTMLRYSKIEHVDSTGEIEHPIFREVLKHFDVTDERLEITSFADIPAGTGLGSSGSFTTALIRALKHYRREVDDKKELAELACHIELDVLKEPIGKQDQCIAAYGGLTCFTYCKNGDIKVEPLRLSSATYHELSDNLLLFSTGITRSASEILKDQDQKSKKQDPDMVQNLHFVKELGEKSLVALESGNLDEFGKLLDVHWQNKKKRSKSISSNKINELYEYGIDHGAIGGKLIGAGGGGFLMFYTKSPRKLKIAMEEIGHKELRYRYDFEGTKVLQGDL